MRTDTPAESEPRALLAWATDTSLGERLAHEWVGAHRPGRRVARTRTHSTLYRGPGDLSTRLDIRLDGDGPEPEITLLVRDRSGEVSATELPDDPFLPTLAEVLGGGTVERLLRGTGLESCVGTGVPSARAVVVHHPREGACVLRLHAGEAEAYAKVYPREEDATAAAEALYAVGTGQVGVRGDEVVRLPRLLTVSAALRTTVLESLRPTGSPEEVAREPLGLEETARALRAFHAHVPTGRLARVPASEHVARVRREQELVATAWPDVAERVDAAVRAAASVLEAFEPLGPGPVLCHGDFTPGQLVRVRGGLGLLDLDTIAIGDPASDLGRFLAYEMVRAQRFTRRPARVAAVRAAFLTAYGAPSRDADPSGLPARVWAYQRLNLALIALRATRRLKGARSGLALTLLDTSDPIPGSLR